ncbi:hypothetical protein [Fontibacillus panacisegetis]|uniref:hypothetical protein n=1 Tax=Fontibacillus panacisegetis TaxID=670482 RepID=UPI000B8608F1|nr:hypothetical protein [Fontibacillus panacisegetis]
MGFVGVKVTAVCGWTERSLALVARVRDWDDQGAVPKVSLLSNLEIAVQGRRSLHRLILPLAMIVSHISW